MKINEKCNLVLRDVYLYDITSCHYSILEKFGFDLSSINKENKLERNIQIGKLMRDNPRLTSLLRTTTESIVSEYLYLNDVQDEEIILRQYDGVLLTRTLKRSIDQKITLDFRSHFQIFISSPNRTSYIAFDGSSVIIKGVPNRYKKIDNVYEKIVKINFLNKQSIFRQMEKIKNDFYTTKDPFLFCIPTKDDKFKVYLEEYGEIEISKSVIKIMSMEDIDKKRYFNFYLKPFFQSLIIEFI